VSHPIAGVATSITAFIGAALRGPTDAPGNVNSFGDFEQLYGGLWAQSTLGYAVAQFFQNGGNHALIVRVGRDDGSEITDVDIIESLPVLDKADLFNLLCIPPLQRRGGEVGRQAWDAAVTYATSRRAFVIVDPPERWATANDVLADEIGVVSVVTIADNAAIYFPRVLASDPLNSGQPDSFAPGGAIAGVFARTDAQSGVWGTPGIEAVLRGVSGLSFGGAASAGKLGDADNAKLNAAGINCLRSFPGTGTVVWGARTLKGADALASDWKYIPVRRLACHIEESIIRGTRWAAFEPNAAPLWGEIAQDIIAFMHTLFKQGAFKGATPGQAYFVHCDGTTTTPADIAGGVINIAIGFAPIRPAEFVTLYIQQISNAGG
jgi:phage tail sheath protein FI